MLEKEPSGASHNLTLTSQPVGAAPGGPFPPAHPPANDNQHPSQPPYSYSLQFLIAVIKKPAK